MAKGKNSSSIIKPPAVVAREQLSVSIDKSVVEALNLYCEMLGSAKLRGHVVQQALELVMNKDPVFAFWRESKGKAAAPPKAATAKGAV